MRTSIKKKILYLVNILLIKDLKIYHQIYYYKAPHLTFTISRQCKSLLLLYVTKPWTQLNKGRHITPTAPNIPQNPQTSCSTQYVRITQTPPLEEDDIPSLQDSAHSPSVRARDSKSDLVLYTHTMHAPVIPVVPPQVMVWYDCMRSSRGPLCRSGVG